MDDGASNTIAIVNTLGPNKTYAAKICSDLVDSYLGYDDWYLPAVYQLQAFYDNNATLNYGDFENEWVDYSSDRYWSSKESSSGFGYIVYIATAGTMITLHKLTNADVRCVRD